MNIKLYKEDKKVCLPLFFIFFSFYLFAQVEGDAQMGAKLFKKECTACHSMDLSKKLIGPALEGITEKRSKQWLHSWIKDNKAFRESGDKEAIAIYEEYGKMEMNAFKHLSSGDIDNILAFIKNPPSEQPPEKQTTKEDTEKASPLYPSIVIVGFIIIAILLGAILLRLYHLSKILKANTLEDYQGSSLSKANVSFSFLYALERNRKFIYGLIGVFLSISLFIVWDYLMYIDVNKGYAPDQPIYFSHKIHAGINKVDCQYCHSSKNMER